MTPITESDLVAHWLAAVTGGPVVAALDEVLAMVDAAITARGPACWGSGRCCHFEAHGHRLYVTGLETALTLSRLTPVQHPTAIATDAAVRAGGCPFQIGTLCGIHTVKPANCRVYFCDRSAQSWQNDLAEEAHRRIAAIHDQFGVVYRYAEWRGLLAMFASGSRADQPLERSCHFTSDQKALPSGLTIEGRGGAG